MTGQLQKWRRKLVLNWIVDRCLFNVSFNNWIFLNFPNWYEAFQWLIFASWLNFIILLEFTFSLYFNMRQVTELFYFLKDNCQFSVIFCVWNDFGKRWTRTPWDKLIIFMCIFNNIEYCFRRCVKCPFFGVMNLTDYLKTNA